MLTRGLLKKLGLKWPTKVLICPYCMQLRVLFVGAANGDSNFGHYFVCLSCQEVAEGIEEEFLAEP